MHAGLMMSTFHPDESLPDHHDIMRPDGGHYLHMDAGMGVAHHEALPHPMGIQAHGMPETPAVFSYMHHDPHINGTPPVDPPRAKNQNAKRRKK